MTGPARQAIAWIGANAERLRDFGNWSLVADQKRNGGKLIRCLAPRGLPAPTGRTCYCPISAPQWATWGNTYRRKDMPSDVSSMIVWATDDMYWEFAEMADYYAVRRTLLVELIHRPNALAAHRAHLDFLAARKRLSR